MSDHPPEDYDLGLWKHRVASISGPLGRFGASKILENTVAEALRLSERISESLEPSMKYLSGG